MASVVGLNVKVGGDIEATVTRHGAKEAKNGIDVVASIEWLGIRVLAPLIANGIGCVLLLEMAGIFQKERRQLDGGGIGENSSIETAADKDGEPASVVEMGVGEDREIESFGIDGKRVPVAIGKIAGSLKEATIYKKPFASRFDEIFGTGNTACRTEKSKFGHRRAFYTKRLARR